MDYHSLLSNQWQKSYPLSLSLFKLKKNDFPSFFFGHFSNVRMRSKLRPGVLRLRIHASALGFGHEANPTPLRPSSWRDCSKWKVFSLPFTGTLKHGTKNDNDNNDYDQNYDCNNNYDNDRNYINHEHYDHDHYDNTKTNQI